MRGTPNRWLIGTDILQAYRRGDDPALDFVQAYGPVGPYLVSQMSVLILLAEAPDDWARTGIAQFLSFAEVFTTTAPIVRKAQSILDRLPPPSPLTADEAVVAATALAKKLPLYTEDPARFAAVPGLTCLRPY